MSSTMIDIPREEWQRALQALPENVLAEVVSNFPKEWQVKPGILPQSGLGLLQLKESTKGDCYYLGEFPLSHCSVHVTTEQGVCAHGAALVLDDRLQRAEQMALCDAVLSAKLPGWDKVEILIEQGELCRLQVATERKAILARTRVDFSLLDEVSDTDD